MASDLSAAWAQVAAVVATVEASAGKWLVDTYGIGLTEYRAALHLSRAADTELRINDLAQKVGLNQSSVTRLVGRLESKQLAFRDTCPDDGRGVYAVLTEHGLDVVTKVRAAYETKLAELLHSVVTQDPHLDLGDLGRAFGIVGTAVG